MGNNNNNEGEEKKKGKVYIYAGQKIRLITKNVFTTWLVWPECIPVYTLFTYSGISLVSWLECRREDNKEHSYKTRQKDKQTRRQTGR